MRGGWVVGGEEVVAVQHLGLLDEIAKPYLVVQAHCSDGLEFYYGPVDERQECQ
jgi:hypothetical protein